MKSILQFATLSYGARRINVVPTTSTPIPTSLDPASPLFLTHVRNIFAMMSNASGGHPIRGCKVAVFRDTVNLTGEDVHVFFKNPEADPVKLGSDEAAVKAFVEMVERERVVTVLGTVVTDQYGDGWQRARWVD